MLYTNITPTKAMAGQESACFFLLVDELCKKCTGKICCICLKLLIVNDGCALRATKIENNTETVVYAHKHCIENYTTNVKGSVVGDDWILDGDEYEEYYFPSDGPFHETI